MKKLLNLLMISSLVASSTSVVVSCRGGAGMSVDYTDQEKMLAITTLNTQKLKDSAVKLGGNISKDQVESLLKLLGINTEGSSSARAVMTASVKAYIMANQLLSQISAKVPGYGWINSKLQWQSQRWGFAQLFSEDTEKAQQAMGKNASGWLKNENEWSLSVTFLNEDLIGWNGRGNPKYARVNINKKIDVDLDGNVVLENSVPEAVHRTDPTMTVSALTPVEQSTHEQTKGRGYVYQGFVNSSSLIDLDGIYDPNDTSIPGSIFSYTPSATDFVNNLLLDSDIENDILIQDKDIIESALNDLLLEEPIYLSEGMNIAHIDVKLKNRIFAALFTGLLDRKNPERGFTEEDLIYANSIMPSYWSQIMSKIKQILNAGYLNDTENAELKEIESTFSQYRSIDLEELGLGLTRAQIDEVYEKLLKVIRWSHNDKAINTGEMSFAVGSLRMNVYKRVPSINGGGNGESSLINLNNVDAYRNFGFNGTSQLVVNYYNQIMPEEEASKLSYDPDGAKNPLNGDEEFISDKGFKNVFFKPRFETLLQEYNLTHNQTLVDNNLVFETPNGTNTLTVEPFDLDEIKNIDDIDSDIWYENAGFYRPGNSHDDWRIAELINYILQSSKKQLIDLFNPEPTNSGKIKQNNIGNYDISTKYLIDGVYDNWNILPKVTDWEQKDDDIAFYELLSKDYQPFHITDSIKDGGSSTLRQNIYLNGLISQQNSYSPELRIMRGNVSTYGEILDTLAHDQWWKSSNYNSDVSQIYLYLNLGSDLNTVNAFKAYWDRHVRNNYSNPDHLA
ncbi:hypothetical protein [Spiroplasma culicicola]|uniref:Lipoprotein n=1 Tax=Spiroplasma culicicola AES-1 TaxID=1276246 RepID=W6A7E2_9MOLU|nr:hypothetical protein [Spiroplasma culicicola]AHI53063.1 hypothetical protein SCULI_v1c07220 [Spiroplasma culicicola AES-1]